MASNLHVLPTVLNSVALLARVEIKPTRFVGIVTAILQTTGGFEYKVRYFDAAGGLQEVWCLPDELAVLGAA